jgi:hypothetical protein
MKAMRLLAVGLFSVGLAACTGKGAEGTCGVVADCGGDPSGNWSVQGFCQYPAVAPYRQMSLSEQTLQPQNPSLEPLQPQPTTDGNWCYDLFYNAPTMMNPDGSITTVNLYHGAPAIDPNNGGTLKFDSTDHTYSIDLHFLQQGATSHFSLYCLQFAGANPTCDQLASQLTAFYMSKSAGTVPFQNIKCAKGSPDGCDCQYDYQVELTDMGAWATNNGNILIESSVEYLYNGQKVMSQAPTINQNVTFCRDGNTLTLTGYEGASLSLAVGLRTLVLQSM